MRAKKLEATLRRGAVAAVLAAGAFGALAETPIAGVPPPPPAAPAPVPTGPVMASNTPLQRLTLSEAYRLALENDANLAAARAQLAGRSERLPQAKSQLWPNVSAAASRFHNDLDQVVPGFTGAPVASQREYYSGNASVTARQPVFRPGIWADVRQAKAQVADAQAQYDKQVQDLAVRVTTAYMQVLLSQEQVALVQSQKKEYTTQLDAARKALVGGTGTRTDIDAAQAQLDLAVAQELQARQNLDYTRRTLQFLTGVPFSEVAGVDEKRLALVPPTPVGLEAWVDRAVAASPEIRSLQSQAEAARQEVEKARAGHLPTVDAIAQWSSSNSDTVTSVNQRYDNVSIGFQVNVPLFAGGYVNSQVRAALAAVTQAEDSLEALRRDLSLRVEKAYRGVTEGVATVQALEQAVRSAQTALDSASKSYKGGVRTIVDVLTAEEKLVQAQKDLAEARFNYMLSRVQLVSLTGEANQTTIDLVNQWLAP
jgi:outer membrane protein/protease secretion system outer membrane protein